MKKNEEDYIPDWYVDAEPDGWLHNINNIRKVSEEKLERASY